MVIGISRKAKKSCNKRATETPSGAVLLLMNIISQSHYATHHLYTHQLKLLHNLVLNISMWENNIIEIDICTIIQQILFKSIGKY